VATTQNTKDADARLKKELENANVEKFKKAMKQGFPSSSKQQPKKK